MQGYSLIMYLSRGLLKTRSHCKTDSRPWSLIIYESVGSYHTMTFYIFAKFWCSNMTACPFSEKQMKGNDITCRCWMWAVQDVRHTEHQFACLYLFEGFNHTFLLPQSRSFFFSMYVFYQYILLDVLSTFEDLKCPQFIFDQHCLVQQFEQSLTSLCAVG